MFVAQQGCASYLVPPMFLKIIFGVDVFSSSTGLIFNFGKTGVGFVGAKSGGEIGLCFSFSLFFFFSFSFLSDFSFFSLSFSFSLSLSFSFSFSFSFSLSFSLSFSFFSFFSFLLFLLDLSLTFFSSGFFSTKSAEIKLIINSYEYYLFKILLLRYNYCTTSTIPGDVRTI